MKVSVIIRTYNRPDFLKQALSSVHFQTHKDWEVLIFDDSADDTNIGVYKSFKETHPENRILYITSATPHYLQKESWSLGFKLADGDLCVRLDDDDLLKEDALEFLSKTYNENPKLDFSYGSAVYFDENGLDYINETKTPYEAPKTKDIWEGYLHQHPYNYPWRFKHNHFDEPQHYTSIIHCSKANEMCSYHVYAIRTKSALNVIDKFKITSNFVDDLEVMGSLEYLGLSHTSIKKVLCYVRNHSDGRLTDKTNSIGNKTLWEDILHIRDKVEYLRPSAFTTNIYDTPIDNNVSETPLNEADRGYFQQYLDKILDQTKTF